MARRIELFALAGVVLGCCAAGIAFVYWMFQLEAHNLDNARSRLAAEQSAAMIEERFPTAPVYKTREDLMVQSFWAVKALGGLYCEFGVGTGASINFLAEQWPALTFHGFDSFKGLPEDWRTGFFEKSFQMPEPPQVRDNVKLHVGWFDETLPGFLASEKSHVSFIHADADLYSSTKTVLGLLGDRLRPGSVIQFDEYMNYPGWRRGEFQAFDEFVAEWGVEFEYLGYCDGPRESEQVAIRILSIRGRAEGEAPAAEQGEAAFPD